MTPKEDKKEKLCAFSVWDGIDLLSFVRLILSEFLYSTVCRDLISV